MTMSWNETTLHHRPFKSVIERIYTLLRITYTATVADVRRFPGSRKYPHFKREYGPGPFPQTILEMYHQVEDDRRLTSVSPLSVVGATRASKRLPITGEHKHSKNVSTRNRSLRSIILLPSYVQKGCHGLVIADL
jgi:hypothetical protein